MSVGGSTCASVSGTLTASFISSGPPWAWLGWLAWILITEGEFHSYEDQQYPYHRLLTRYDVWESQDWETPSVVWKTVLASVVLDYILAGSEIVHRVKLHYTK